ncbi:MAG: KH domain-containing protein [Acidobacteria bacterium]|nr:KH domain-containing protein [Acidobacteriota bacterium]
MSDSSEIDYICDLLSLMVRELVTDKNAVTVTPIRCSDASTVIQIKVSRGEDTGKVIGKQGRTARSLRILFQAILKERSSGDNYYFDIVGSKDVSREDDPR